MKVADITFNISRTKIMVTIRAINKLIHSIYTSVRRFLDHCKDSNLENVIRVSKQVFPSNLKQKIFRYLIKISYFLKSLVKYIEDSNIPFDL